MERSLRCFILSVFLLPVILSGSVSSAARLLPRESERTATDSKDGNEEVTKMMMIANEDDLIKQAKIGFPSIGMELSDEEEGCGEREEDCPKWKEFADANLDYIYTQHFDP